jgi:hypothetical protein
MATTMGYVREALNRRSATRSPAPRRPSFARSFARRIGPLGITARINLQKRGVPAGIAQFDGRGKPKKRAIWALNADFAA